MAFRKWNKTETGWTKVLVAGILLLMLVFAVVRPERVSAREEEPLTLTVSYGLIGEEARCGRTCVFTIELSNGGTAVEGEVWLTVASAYPQGGTRYEKAVRIGAGQTETVQFQIKAESSVSRYQVSLISADGEVLAETEAPFQMINYGDFTQIGLYTEIQKGWSYLEDFGSRLLYLDEHNLPEDKNELDSLDILLVDATGNANFSVKQSEAVGEWVEAGGLLILSPGARIGTLENTGEKLGEALLTFGSDKEDFRKLRELVNQYEEERGNIQLEVNEAKKKIGTAPKIYFGKSMLEGRMLSDMQAVPVERVIYRLSAEESEVCIREGTYILAVVKHLGKGRVMYLAFSPTFQEPVWTAAQTWLSWFFKQQLSETGKQKLDSEKYGYARDYWFYDILETADQEQLPSVGTYFILFVVYLLTASPVLYFVLRRMDRTKYIWGAVPVTAILFTLAAYAGGSSTRVKEPFFGYFNMETINQDTGDVKGNLNFYVSLPNNQRHSFTLKNSQELTLEVKEPEISYYTLLYNDILPFTSLPVRFDSITSSIAYEKERTKLSIGSLPAFSKTYYASNYSGKYEQVPSGKVIVDADSLEGSVTNLLPFSLEDSFVYSNRICVELGTVKSGETVEFTSDEAFNAANQELIYFFQNEEEQYQKWNAEQKRRDSAVKYTMLETITKEDSYLIGFSEKITEKNPLYELELGKNSYGTTILLIPLEEDNTREGQSFVANMDNYLEVVDGNLEEKGQRYITTESLVVNYYLPQEDEVTEILLSGMFNRLPETDYSIDMAGDIYFFNFVNGSYDFVFRCDSETSLRTQSISGEQLKYYMDESNMIRVRFVNTSLESNCLLPYLSYYKKK